MNNVGINGDTAHNNNPGAPETTEFDTPVPKKATKRGRSKSLEIDEKTALKKFKKVCGKMAANGGIEGKNIEKTMTTPQNPKGKKCSNEELLAAIHALSGDMNNRMSKIEKSLSERIDRLENSIEVKVLEKLDTIIEHKVVNKVAEVRESFASSTKEIQENVDSLRELVLQSIESQKLTNDSNSGVKHNIVIWNLATSENEENDPTVILQAVNKLLTDGLNLIDVKATAATRKPPKEKNIGVVIATLDSHTSVQKVMKAKVALKNNVDYSSVFVNRELSNDTLTYQNNMKKLLKELGREKDFKFHNGVMVKK